MTANLAPDRRRYPTVPSGKLAGLLTTEWIFLSMSALRMPMFAATPRKLDFDSLCETVENRLCELGHLEPRQFPMTQREVVRAGKPVGVYFCVHGPRSVKLTAICDFDHSTVIFYGSDGIRRDSLKVNMAPFSLGRSCSA